MIKARFLLKRYGLWHTKFMNDTLQLGAYQHYKGNKYTVIAVATHTETEEPMVVYRAQYGDEYVWVRPLAMFRETVVIEGVEQPRFTYIEEATSAATEA